jgi:hypothetical protein
MACGGRGAAASAGEGEPAGVVTTMGGEPGEPFGDSPGETTGEGVAGEGAPLREERQKDMSSASEAMPRVRQGRGGLGGCSDHDALGGEHEGVRVQAQYSVFGKFCRRQAAL